MGTAFTLLTIAGVFILGICIGMVAGHDRAMDEMRFWSEVSSTDPWESPDEKYKYKLLGLLDDVEEGQASYELIPGLYAALDLWEEVT